MPDGPGVFFNDEGGHGPGTHALIVGVSDYRFLDETQGEIRTLGLVKLNSAALSALRFARWLVDNRAQLPRRLASVRLLIAAAPSEVASPLWQQLQLAGYQPLEPTLANFRLAAAAWQADVARSNDEVSVFYYTGHGIRLTDRNDAMLLSDFGQLGAPVLTNAVEFSNILNGMAPSELNPEIAQNQFYFVDACRLPADRMDEKISKRMADAIQEGVSRVFDAPQGNDERVWGVLFATSTDTKAKSRPGNISFFCEALIDALPSACDQTRTEGARVIYPVKWGPLRQLVEERLRRFGIAPKPILNGQNAEQAEFAHLPGPPSVAISIGLDPDAVIDGATVTILDLEGQAIPPPIAPNRTGHPYPRDLPMGYYKLRADMPPQSVQQLGVVTPINRSFKLTFP